MNLIAGPLCQPGSHFRMLVGGVTVDDPVDIQLRRDAVVEGGARKREKLLMPVAMSSAANRVVVPWRI